jgi:hypothetical protein
VRQQLLADLLVHQLQRCQGLPRRHEQFPRLLQLLLQLALVRHPGKKLLPLLPCGHKQLQRAAAAQQPASAQQCAIVLAGHQQLPEQLALGLDAAMRHLSSKHVVVQCGLAVAGDVAAAKLHQHVADVGVRQHLCTGVRAGAQQLQ